MHEVQVQLETFEQPKKLENRQREYKEAIGVSGESSSMPPFRPSLGVDSVGGGGGVGASGSGSGSDSGNGSVSIGPKVCASRLDSYVLPHTTPSSQPSLESMGWNGDKHDAAK